MGVPVYDFSKLDGEERAVTMAQIHNGCEEWGFFQLVNHGISEELLERVKKISSDCYKLEREENFKKSKPVTRLNEIVESKSEEKLDDVDWEDVFLLTDDNEWPSNLPGFKETMTEYRAELRKLAEKLTEIMDENLGLPKGYIKAAFNSGESSEEVDETAFFGTKVSHYPPCPHPELVTGLRAHTDAGGVILLFQDDIVAAANSVNIWSGVSTVMPLLGGFLADAYTGRYFMILFSAILYVLSLGIFTMTQYIPSLKPCGTTTSSPCQHASKVHGTVFFVAAYLMALATGGYKPCLESFGGDQFDDNNPKERKQKMSFFNWWNIAVCSGLFVGVTLIVYIQENVSWGIGFITLTITMGVTVLVFFLGRPFYQSRNALGSPLTPLVQVLVAAIAKRNLPYPSNPSLLYEAINSDELQPRLLGHTNRLRFLDKAAIVEKYKSNEVVLKKKQSPWRLATVTQVEELKLIIAMFPIWLTSLVFGIGNALGPTFFIKQGSVMNRKMFNHFEIPAASMTASLVVYDKVLLPYLRRVTGNERGINILTRIGIGMVILIATMVVSALVERVRLNAILQGNTIHVYWLVPQILMSGIGDGFSLVGLQEYYYEQVPDSMRSLGMAFYLSVNGIGSFLMSFVITIVDYMTGMNGGKKWIGKEQSS